MDVLTQARIRMAIRLAYDVCCLGWDEDKCRQMAKKNELTAYVLDQSISWNRKIQNDREGGANMNYFRILLRQIVEATNDSDFQVAMRAVDRYHASGLLDDVRYNAMLDAAAFYNPISYAFYMRRISREREMKGE